MIFFEFLVALALTLLIELCVAYFFLCENKKWLKTVVFANLVTHPVLSYTLWINMNTHLFHVDYATLFVVETIVVVIEAVLLCWALKSKFFGMLMVSFFMNGTSCLLGLVILSRLI